MSTPTRAHTNPAPAAPKRPRRWLRYLALTVVGLLVAAATGAYGFARRSLPQVSGELRVAGLEAPVYVYRDQWGVPHIEAQTMHDLYLAQGFVTAQDRLWAMDISRRAAAGRLSEIFGADYVPSDKFLRTMMLRRSAEQSFDAISPWVRDVLEAYAAGVSAYIAQATAGGRLPIEFTLLGYEPEPWTALDSLSIGKLLAWQLNGDQLNRDIFYYQLRQTVGDALLKQVLPSYPEDGITIMRYNSSTSVVGSSAVTELPPDSSQIDMKPLLALGLFPDPAIGSNNWVISGKMTASGKPLLANDPHLGFSAPAVWYQTHLRLDGDAQKLNVIGVALPGAPGVIIGRNDKIAWGLTNTAPDVGDLYIERRNPANPYQFEYQGQWEDATVYKESIKVKGMPDVLYEVVVTRHGPLVSEVTGSRDNRPNDALAFRWTVHLPSAELEAVLRFDRASNWSEFRDALRYLTAPMQNYVFASEDGTIAYRPGGVIPIRAQGDGLVPVPGWTGTYEWTGYIPFEELPEVVNPAEGYIVSANNKVIDGGYPYLITHAWELPYRAARIDEVLKGKAGLTADDMRELQLDVTNLQARTLLPVLLPALEGTALSDVEQAALDTLRSWDYVDAPDQAAPLVFQLWWKHLQQALLEPQMGADLFSRMEHRYRVADALVRQAAKGEPNDWVKAAGGLAKAAAESFKRAVAEGVRMQGESPRKWEWGEFHRLGPQHSLGAAVAPLGWFLNTKAQPIGGSKPTVSQMAFDEVTAWPPTGLCGARLLTWLTSKETLTML